MYKSIKSCLALLTLALIFAPSIAQESKFNWPNDKKIAVSLTWDDGINMVLKLHFMSFQVPLQNLWTDGKRQYPMVMKLEIIP
jgi:hypothetical protein